MHKIRMNVDKLSNKQQIDNACDLILKHIKEDDDIKAIRGKAQEAFVEFVEDFMNSVKEHRYPENLGDNWFYGIEVTEDHIALAMHHYKAGDENGAIDDIVTILDADAPLISVSEYAKLHDYSEQEVLDWLNRGKFRKAEKHKSSWMIPSFSEPCKGFEDGVFHVRETLEGLPEQLKFVSKYSTIATKEVDGKNYILCIGFQKTDDGYERIKDKHIISDEEREQLEAVLTADRDVISTHSSLCMSYFDKM